MTRSLLCLFFTLLGCGQTGEIEEAEKTEPELEVIHAPDWVKKIRAERAKIRPMEESLLPKITEQYNQDLARAPLATRCLEHWELFQTVEDLTLFPAELLAGKALHESRCDPEAVDWAGGRGLLQVTSVPSKTQFKAVATLLEIDVSDVDYLNTPLHNVLMGTVMLDSWEREFGSRFHGLQAYNLGSGGMRRDMRQAGWKKGEPLPDLLSVKPYIAYNKRIKPRIHVQRVIAGAIMVAKARRGEEITRQEGGDFAPEDIPGWYPAHDGNSYLGQVALR